MCHSELPTARRLLSVADVQVANFCFPARPAPSRHGPLGVGARGRASVSWSVLVWFLVSSSQWLGDTCHAHKDTWLVSPIGRRQLAVSRLTAGWGSPKGRLAAGRRASQLEALLEPKPWGLGFMNPTPDQSTLVRAAPNPKEGLSFWWSQNIPVWVFLRCSTLQEAKVVCNCGELTKGTHVNSE